MPQESHDEKVGGRDRCDGRIMAKFNNNTLGEFVLFSLHLKSTAEL